MNNLIMRESGFNPNARNPSSGACGLFQALPCSKVANLCPNMAVECQVKWGIGYIASRYGSPQRAWEFWLSQSPHWY